MRIVAVPTYILDEINRRLDEQIALHPEAEKDRDHLRAQLLDHLDRTGLIPSFSLAKPEGPKP